MRRLTLIVGFIWVGLGAWAVGYAVLRGSHRLTHRAIWTSEEGLHGHHMHDIVSTNEVLLDAFGPLVWLETGAHDILE
ncbi:MAG: hypothetical protein Q8L14_30120 [Myxococcales bacterium]|nr:hypothetical protein [Myxococcales bacterium]